MFFDFYDIHLSDTKGELNKIKRAMQVMTFLALINERDSFKYKVLERYIEFCEDYISEIWY